MWDNPKQVADMTIEYWAAQQALWQNAMLKWLGAKDAQRDLELPHMMKADKRFAHKEWSENPVFDYLKQQYLLTAGWLQDAVATVGEMEPSDRKKAVFYTRAYTEAMNPANFFYLNPEVLETTIRERGGNLVRGLRMMLEDLERGEGKLLPRQTDVDAFEVGRNTAISEGAVIWRNHLLELIQYAPLTDKVHARPLLFVPPWINKYYILDLNPKKSMVKWLVEQGYTVFMISWVNPDERHGDETWESYMFDGAVAAIDKVLEETRQKSLNLVSYCVGGPSPVRCSPTSGSRRTSASPPAPSSPRSSISRTPASCRCSSTTGRSRCSARRWSKASCRRTGWRMHSTCCAPTI
jgi:polyhydroxyalkanoate synthase subunit PhaC